MEKRKVSGWLLTGAFAAIYFVWGTTYLANLFALQGIPPFTVSCFRYLAAGAVLAVWVKWKRYPLPDKRSLKVLCISGILMLVGGSGMIVSRIRCTRAGVFKIRGA